VTETERQRETRDMEGRNTETEVKSFRKRKPRRQVQKEVVR
jgi:hypothetical protein